MNTLLNEIDEFVSHAVNQQSAQRIVDECLDLAVFLIGKNNAYGDSALNPRPVFTHANASQRLRTRIDDKLNRIFNQQSYAGDDDVLDLVGYLILLRIAERDLVDGRGDDQ